MGQRWARWREVLIVGLVFLAVLGISWGVCAAIGHPHDGSNRWVVCVGFATVVATAVGIVVHRLSREDEPAPAVTTFEVEGDNIRAAGAGAYGNVFGDRASKGTTGSGPRQLPSSAERAAPAQNMTVRGNGNRVAGPGAHDNDFGDDPDSHTP